MLLFANMLNDSAIPSFYIAVHKKTGKYVTFLEGDGFFKLSMVQANPVWTSEDPQELRRILKNPVEWFRVSAAQYPQHELISEDFRIVRCDVTIDQWFHEGEDK